jgi:starch phosphorylase
VSKLADTNEAPFASLGEFKKLGMDESSIAKAFHAYFTQTLGCDDECANRYYHYAALALGIRARLLERWRNTDAAYRQVDARRTYYLSMEFLIGRTLGNTMLNLDIENAVTDALHRYGLEFEEIANQEPDAGLGNGGLGRLAACFLDSAATLQLPVQGYGIRYDHGMFRQLIEDGYQIEEPDSWLRDGNPWEIERPEDTRTIRFGGRTQMAKGRDGRVRYEWINTHDVLAIPYDIPVPGYHNNTVNRLRLWSAKATDIFDLDEFNMGSYDEAVRAKNQAENISMVLYPNDASENGKELRLRQQYFLASASLQDVLAYWKQHHGNDFTQFAEKNCFQLNDTHPAISVAELMRLLVDEEDMPWDQAWEITRSTMAYTNHTLLPEALERWSVPLFESLLPRLLEIIYEINARFLAEVGKRWPGDTDRMRRMSIIEEGHQKQVRMANLAIVGSFSVNGVAQLHSDLIRQNLFHDFAELWPQKFNNKTNGVTHRRWLGYANPDMRQLLNQTIGEDWVRDLTQLKKLKPLADDKAFQKKWQQVKNVNKQRLADLVEQECGVHLDVNAMFDVQVKRIHEYKRQLLNALHLIHLYQRIKEGDVQDWTPRAVLIGGKAAPGYAQAKLIIKLINNVANVINNDPDCDGLLKAVFFPNYRVTAMETICPGTDLSEQISTAGKEASGTGNMKFMMNGALTIGTLDGANIEILDAVGEDHFFLFGLTAQEASEMRQHYDPVAIIAKDKDLQKVLSLIEGSYFNQFEPGIFDPIVRSVRDPGDPWLVAADFADYVDAQRQAAELYQDREKWLRSSIMNTACSGEFSTDRTIRDYNEDIWRLPSVKPLDRGF